MRPPVFDSDWPIGVQALYAHDMREMWDQRIAPHIWNQYHNQLDTYLAFAGTRPTDILDVGCAQGTLALLLAERGHHVTAVDLRPEFLEYAKSRYVHGDIRFIAANVLEDDLQGTYDLIFANQIVEHLVYPGKMLSRLKDRLKPGGRLVVATPNGDYVKNPLPSYKALGNPEKWEHLQNTADGDGHFFAYRQEELVDLLFAAGFKDVQAKCFESPFISGHMKIRYVHGYVPVGLLKSLDRAVAYLPWLSRRFGHQLLVTGIESGKGRN